MKRLFEIVLITVALGLIYMALAGELSTNAGVTGAALLALRFVVSMLRIAVIASVALLVVYAVIHFHLIDMNMIGFILKKLFALASNN